MPSMGYFDEVCFLCGVSPHGPSEFTGDPDITAEDLTDALLKHFPNILSAIPDYNTREDLKAFLEVIFREDDLENFEDLSDAFGECVAIGYFDNDGSAPRKEVDDLVVKYLLYDGRFVERRSVLEPCRGQFRRMVYVDSDYESDREGDGLRYTTLSTEKVTNTSSVIQKGFGNFFLSECCVGFLEGWIEQAALPPMWDGRELSFEGELWEIVNSRKAARKYDGCLQWLEPGGAEKKLEETQNFLSTIVYGEVYPMKTATALQSGYSHTSIRRAIYEDYGYWMFVSPHEWPKVPESQDDLAEVTAIGFDVPPRARQISLSLGRFSCLAIEILSQIFCVLPNVTTYINLKLVSKGMHDLVTDTTFALPILREIIAPDPTRDMLWIYPLYRQRGEYHNFKNCLYSWLSLKCSSVEEGSITAREMLLHREFPLIQFIHSLYTSDCSRNRRRLWKNVKKFEEVWVDYRRNGWEVNRFRLPYTGPCKE